MPAAKWSAERSKWRFCRARRAAPAGAESQCGSTGGVGRERTLSFVEGDEGVELVEMKDTAEVKAAEAMAGVRRCGLELGRTERGCRCRKATRWGPQSSE